MTLVLATANRDKGREMTQILSDFLEWPIRYLWDYPHVALPPEEGLTYKENARQKAVTVARATGEWALGDDSGLEIAALDGAPGLYSARFAGEGVSYADNRKKVLSLLSNRPGAGRSAQFVCTMAIANPHGEMAAVVEGVCRGSIAFSETGGSGFGYDPIFYLPEYKKTLAELTPDEKNRISHRGKALRAIIEILKKQSFSGCGAAW